MYVSPGSIYLLLHISLNYESRKKTLFSSATHLPVKFKYFSVTALFDYRNYIKQNTQTAVQTFKWYMFGWWLICLGQGCLTQLDEEFVFNPLTLTSNLYQHLRSRGLSQPRYPYRYHGFYYHYPHKCEDSAHIRLNLSEEGSLGDIWWWYWCSRVQPASHRDQPQPLEGPKTTASRQPRQVNRPALWQCKGHPVELNDHHMSKHNKLHKRSFDRAIFSKLWFIVRTHNFTSSSLPRSLGGSTHYMQTVSQVQTFCVS